MAIPQAAAWGRYRAHLVRHHRSPKTISTYRGALYAFWASLDGRGWDRARAVDLERFLRRPRSGRPLAPKSAELYCTSIRRFYAWATARRLLRRDPMAEVVPPRAGRPIPRSLPLAQVGEVLRHAAGDDRLRVMLWLGYGAGLRAGEIAAVRVEDLRLDDDPATVRVRHGKGDRERVVPLAGPVRAVLAAYLASEGLPRSGPLVASRLFPGQPLGAHYVSELLGRALRGAGVAATGHQLRHTWATELLKAGRGTNLRAVSRGLGHASLTTTELYTSAYDADLVASVALLPDPRVAGVRGAPSPPG
jgi:integrase/recombinase XerD